MTTSTRARLGFALLLPKQASRKHKSQFTWLERRAYSPKFSHHQHQDWDYTWRDWMMERKKTIYRLLGVSIMAGGYYWYHLETVPISGRRQFIHMSKHQESWMAKLSFDEIVDKYGSYILSSNHPISRHVCKVAMRIIHALDPALVSPNTKWRVFVIDLPVANAFVLPGGEIFVFTGILPYATSEDGLAAVLGHEIAHKVARHGAEKLSLFYFVSLLALALQVIATGDTHLPFADLMKNILVYLPFSRKMETEADYIGLQLMAKACYDPKAAIDLWKKMDKTPVGQKPPEFLSTHPSPSTRIETIEKQVSKAQQIYLEAGCAEMAGSFDHFFSKARND